MEFPISVERPGHKCCFMHGGFWLHIVLMMNSHNLFRRSFELKHRKAHESRLLNLTNNSLNYARVSLRSKFMGNKSMAWRIRRQNVSRNRAITFSFLLYPSHYSLFAEPPLNAFLRFLKSHLHDCYEATFVRLIRYGNYFTYLRRRGKGEQPTHNRWRSLKVTQNKEISV